MQQFPQKGRESAGMRSAQRPRGPVRVCAGSNSGGFSGCSLAMPAGVGRPAGKAGNVPRRVTILTLAGILGAAGIAVLPPSNAYANTVCATYISGHDSGVASDGGSTYWGWCHPNGGFVRFKLTIICPGGWGSSQSDWASGSGYGTIYTNSLTCWFGNQADQTILDDG